MDAADIYSLVALGKCARQYSHSANIQINNRIKAFWGRYGDYTALSNLLRVTNAYATGPALLSFLLSPRYGIPHIPFDNRLDIYTSAAGFVGLVHTLSGAEHSPYKLAETAYYGPWDAALTYHYVTIRQDLEHKTDPSIKISVYEIFDDHPLTSILTFNATHEMNMLGSSSLYSFYPSLTRRRRAVIQPGDEIDPSTLESWETMGFQVENAPREVCPGFCARRAARCEPPAYMHVRVDNPSPALTVVHPPTIDEIPHHIQWYFNIKHTCDNFNCPNQSCDPADYMLNRLALDWNAGSF
ncbi:hypothetical protein SISNIDRAFT_492063 [Sistotremastrum niveocremeum HHB9708]|uniref:Uncharacterized protein n=1 Tax=Sistotremastrum niveocremeum HHB9708 TaxID=1314777 RepID=A0A164M3N0_9AGAM|nr:hypothetical protein SISNIDRAFT_492063 [Sistotremastrum niveocremeum HHB9708]